MQIFRIYTYLYSFGIIVKSIVNITENIVEARSFFIQNCISIKRVKLIPNHQEIMFCILPLRMRCRVVPLNLVIYNVVKSIYCESQFRQRNHLR